MHLRRPPREKEGKRKERKEGAKLVPDLGFYSCLARVTQSASKKKKTQDARAMMGIKTGTSFVCFPSVPMVGFCWDRELPRCKRHTPQCICGV